MKFVVITDMTHKIFTTQESNDCPLGPRGATLTYNSKFKVISRGGNEYFRQNTLFINDSLKFSTAMMLALVQYKSESLYPLFQMHLLTSSVIDQMQLHKLLTLLQ